MMTVAREQVLVVDDNPAELNMLADALTGAGYEVAAASSGEAALDFCASEVPDAIVLDALMAGMNGFEACRRLKQNARFLHVPILFLTGLTDTGHVLEGLEAGSVDYVTKPVIFSELAARIRVHISNARIAQGTRVALDFTGRHLLAVDGQGRLLWSTPQAAALLRQSFCMPEQGRELTDCEAAQFADLIAVGVSEAPVLRIGTLTASFLCDAGHGEYMFRITAASQASEISALQDLGLTLREAEVLLWIARGKSNQDIGEILAISSRTVDKHAERIFTKLGVENRSSAASVALRVLIGRL
jgi:DNA-binding response OmpR family regulator/DNA-binding CsgD family transcriptional regulator